MTIERRFDLLGYRFVFRTNSSRAAELVSALYFGREDSSSSRIANSYELRQVGDGRDAHWTIGVQGPAVHAQPTLGHSLAIIEASIVDSLVRQNVGMHLIHGAIVYAPGGDLLLSGDSGCGKTTLSLALTARGFRVGGDDLAALDPFTNAVQPVPRCFHIDQRSAQLLGAFGLALPADAITDSFVTPQHLGMAGVQPAHIRFVFLLEMERRSTPRLASETQARTVANLLRQTGRGHFSSREGVNALSRLVAGCRCYRLWSGSLATTVDEVVGVVRHTHSSC